MYKIITQAKDQRHEKPLSFNVEFTKPFNISDPMLNFMLMINTLKESVGKEYLYYNLFSIANNWALNNQYFMSYSEEFNLYEFNYIAL
jgi:hypothetical protein